MLANDKWTKRSSTAAWTTRRSQLCLDTQPRIPSHSALGSISQWSVRPRHAKPRSELTRTASAGSEPTAGQSRSQPSSRNHARPPRPPPLEHSPSNRGQAGTPQTAQTSTERCTGLPPHPHLHHGFLIAIYPRLVRGTRKLMTARLTRAIGASTSLAALVQLALRLIPLALTSEESTTQGTAGTKPRQQSRPAKHCWRRYQTPEAA